ncbi:uncharacterized protein N7473_013191 [Penicillium subrubescens]|uniref:Uncharacterized protein n=1 Tax=Penicillium subrubescens TaxID=1316194 RepID=A0A1Q5ST05_9EURO|nr:uncharacterized protein N7473_013191 [Penicillium subrubescens]KAJ5873632.1 hypothetical protein N7473_013191 [Penicillium subrubescens]OKO91129.1 hypothetical protein PENSUB_13118 [Penicillium subrubescens]
MAKLVTERTVTQRTCPDMALLLEIGGWRGLDALRGLASSSRGTMSFGFLSPSVQEEQHGCSKKGRPAAEETLSLV